MNAYVVSFKYSPGHFSHLKAYYKIFELLGYRSLMLLDYNYNNFQKELNNVNHLFFDNLTKVDFEDGDIILIENPALINHKFIKRVKEKSKQIKVLYVYHEPWDGYKNYLKEGIKQMIKSKIANIYSRKTIRLCDCVLIPSRFSISNYEKYEKNLNNNYYYFPLIFDDELCDLDKWRLPCEKKYFSFIGHAVKGHNFSGFVNFVKYSYLNKIDFKFQIVTRSNIKKYLDDEVIAKAIQENYLKVINKNFISNEEINKAYLDSWCIWCIYNRSSQSGVLPKAFMFGTPVVANNIGSFTEFIQNGCNGIILDKVDYKTLVSTVNNIKLNISYYSKNARETFEKVFYYKSNKARLDAIVNQKTNKLKI